MKKCVFIAPNDRYNYGDLLFSHILRAKIGVYYDELVDVATIDADLSRYGGHKVCSIRSIKKHSKNHSFDVVLAGGHSLFCPWPFVLYCLDDKYVWLSKLSVLLSKILGQSKSKAIINNLSKFVFGGKTRYPYSIGKFEIKGIRKIIYNSVDGNLETRLDTEDKKILMSIDYLSVRNIKTCRQLKSNGLTVYAYPDSAIQISKVFPIESLSDKFSIPKQSFNTPYIVFQINRGLGERHFSEIVANLKELIATYDYKIYLCPIGFAKGHDDLIVLSRLYDKLESNKVILFDNLNIWDIIGLIANSRGFIGSSLHGCITAMSYCIPYIGLEVSKTVDYIKDWGLGDDYCADCGNFSSKFSNVISCSAELLRENLQFQLIRSDESFKNIQKTLII